MDGNGIREASVIVAPPETCPNCSRHQVPAQESIYATKISGILRGWYRCPDCHLVWDTTWRIEPR